MRYIIDITQKQAEEIESFIKSGRYNNVAQFIITAVENQIFIEKTELRPKSEEKIILKKKFHDKYGTYEEDPDIYLPPVTNISPKPIAEPSFSHLACSLQKLDEEKSWLWGQVNKIFPIKLGLRVLLTLLQEEQWIDLEFYTNKAADVALAYGEKIRKYEDAQDKKRDERISAGLPHASKNEKEKWIEVSSKARYKAHFLAYVRKDGMLEGAMPYLRFVNLKKDEKGKILIGITEEGLSFAKLDNPVIDKHNFEKSFNEKEIGFYLGHVSKKVKGEYSAIKWLLKKLANGVTGREEINNELKKEFSQIWKASDAVINTQRAGLMARTFELGLIMKKKNGVKVKYEISPLGKEFLRGEVLSQNE